MKVKETALQYKTSKKKYTYQDYLEMPDDGKRYEIICGDLIMAPAPNTIHQKVALKIEYELLKFNDKENKGELFHAPYDVVMSDMNVVQPDILFVKTENLGIITDKNIDGSPDLIIEILSPSSSYYDQVQKKEMYARFGIQEYWIVDPIKQSIEIYLNKEYEFELKQRLLKEGEAKSEVLNGFRIELKEIFKLD